MCVHVHVVSLEARFSGTGAMDSGGPPRGAQNGTQVPTESVVLLTAGPPPQHQKNELLKPKLILAKVPRILISSKYHVSKILLTL